jgi:transglycosylase-like protein with SLT domain
MAAQAFVKGAQVVGKGVKRAKAGVRAGKRAGRLARSGVRAARGTARAGVHHRARGPVSTASKALRRAGRPRPAPSRPHRAPPSKPGGPTRPAGGRSSGARSRGPGARSGANRLTPSRSAGGRPASPADPGQPQAEANLPGQGRHASETVVAAAAGAGAVAKAVRHPIKGLGRAAKYAWQRRKHGATAMRQRAQVRRRRKLRLALMGMLLLGTSASTVPMMGLGNGGLSEGRRTSGGDAGGSGPITEGAGIPYVEVFNSTEDIGIDPRLVAAVAWQESDHFDEDVIACERTSSEGALGIMQFMPDTAGGRDDGRGIDPCDPEEAIPEGAEYLVENHERFGTWELALAAYNAGPNGEVATCRCVPRNGETEDYVPAVMAQWGVYKDRFPNGGVGEEAGPARQEIIERAYTWLNASCPDTAPLHVDYTTMDCGVPYSMTDTYEGWRTDCSGYVSMAWNLDRPEIPIGADTTGLGNTYAVPIDKEELLPGDILLKPKSGSAGHVVLFEDWANEEHTEYWGLEQTGGAMQTVRRRIPYPYFEGGYSPYRSEELA